MCTGGLCVLDGRASMTMCTWRKSPNNFPSPLRVIMEYTTVMKQSDLSISFYQFKMALIMLDIHLKHIR